jgi:hypothetical protein
MFIINRIWFRVRVLCSVVCVQWFRTLLNSILFEDMIFLSEKGILRYTSEVTERRVLDSITQPNEHTFS